MADKSAPAGPFEAKVAQVLAALVKERGLSTSELARRAGLSQPFVSQILSGQRGYKMDTLLALCEGLGVPWSTVAARYDAEVESAKRDAGTGRRTG